MHTIAQRVLLVSAIAIGCGSNAAQDPSYAGSGGSHSTTVPNGGTTSGGVSSTAGGNSDPTNAGDAAVTYPISLASWPSDATITIACAKNAFGENMSSLVYEPVTEAVPATLWALQNEPSKVHRLTWDGTAFTRITSDGWITGKSLRYPDGTGDPDSEGMTRTDWSSNELYVVAERDNENKAVARQSILRYDLTGSKGVLSATNEWNLTNDLPAFEANSGLEGIAWIPDSYLVSRGFIDDSKQALYDPASYANHGSGIFLVGVDATGTIYAYVLDHLSNTFTRLATFGSGQARSVDLSFDRDNGTLWSLCDGKCNDRTTLLDIETDPTSTGFGHFAMRVSVPAPKSVRDMNHEGLAFAPDSECLNNRKAFYWADDGNTNGYALRKGTISCGRLY